MIPIICNLSPEMRAGFTKKAGVPHGKPTPKKIITISFLLIIIRIVVL